jgi:transposase
MSVISVQTKYNSDFITQEIIAEDSKWDTNLYASVIKRVIHLQEEGIREALIKLGWTPPKEEQSGKSN